MTSASDALQGALVAKLNGSSLFTGVYYDAPARAVFPYAVVNRSDERDWSCVGRSGREISLQLVLWDEQPSRLSTREGEAEVLLQALDTGPVWHLSTFVLTGKRRSPKPGRAVELHLRISRSPDRAREWRFGMSLPLRGSDCVLRICDPGTSSGFVFVEGLRLSGWKILQEQVEVTDGGDEGWRRLLPGAGLRSLELAFSGMYLGSIGEHLLRDKAFRGEAVECALTLDDGTAVRGRFIALSLSFESMVNEEATYAATLRSAGAVTID